MVELGEFHLQLAFLRLGALGENGENQPHAVQHAALQGAFQIALLGGRELVVEDDELDVVLLHKLGEFFGFARAHKQSGVRFVALGGFAANQFAACGAHQFGGLHAGSLKTAFARLVAARILAGQQHGNQHDALGLGEGFVGGVGHGGLSGEAA